MATWVLVTPLALARGEWGVGGRGNDLLLPLSRAGPRLASSHLPCALSIQLVLVSTPSRTDPPDTATVLTGLSVGKNQAGGES